MWDLRHSRVVAMGLSAACFMAATSLARTIADYRPSGAGGFPQSGAPYLPVGRLAPPPLGNVAIPYTGPQLQGEYGIVTLNAKTGKSTWTVNPPFDNPNQTWQTFYPLDFVPGVNPPQYDVEMAFRPAQNGVTD